MSRICLVRLIHHNTPVGQVGGVVLSSENPEARKPDPPRSDKPSVESWELQYHYIPISEPPLFEPARMFRCGSCGRYTEASRTVCGDCGTQRPRGLPVTVWVPTGFRLDQLSTLVLQGGAIPDPRQDADDEDDEPEEGCNDDEQ